MRVGRGVLALCWKLVTKISRSTPDNMSEKNTSEVTPQHDLISYITLNFVIKPETKTGSFSQKITVYTCLLKGNDDKYFLSFHLKEIQKQCIEVYYKIFISVLLGVPFRSKLYELREYIETIHRTYQIT